MADYLEAYARHFDLPVRTGIRVDACGVTAARYIVDAGDRRFEADHVVVAMATYQAPRVPEFARSLDPRSCSCTPASTGTRPAAAGRRTGRRRREFRRGHRSGGRAIAPHMAVRAASRPRTVPHRQPHGARRAAAPVPVRVSPDLDDRHPDGATRTPRMISKGGPLIRVKPADLAAGGRGTGAARHGRPRAASRSSRTAARLTSRM